MAKPWEYAFAPVDPLGEALHSLRLSGTFYCRSELRAPWGIKMPPIPGCMLFHIVTSGSCIADVGGRARQRLGPGDMVLYPHGRGHNLRSDPQAKVVDLFDLPRQMVSPRYELLSWGGDGEETHAICGAVSVGERSAKRLVERLPEMLLLKGDAPEHAWLFGTIRLMASEAQSLQPGGDTVITRVADILVVQGIRAWLRSDPQARRGWLGALHDPQLGKALALVHRTPTAPWTVESLAAQVGMSRSAFAARFMQQLGEPPMAYLRARRFDLAVDWLEEGALTIADIAQTLGYQSEAAFNRAFKRHVDRTPGAVRRAAAQRPASSASS